jgi:predicted amidophosphoribosyltransferase
MKFNEMLIAVTEVGNGYEAGNRMLIDDVMTTGASLDECARTLKLHGASRVSVLVLARALPRSATDPGTP